VRRPRRDHEPQAEHQERTHRVQRAPRGPSPALLSDGHGCVRRGSGAERAALPPAARAETAPGPRVPDSRLTRAAALARVIGEGSRPAVYVGLAPVMNTKRPRPVASTRLLENSSIRPSTSA